MLTQGLGDDTHEEADAGSGRITAARGVGGEDDDAEAEADGSWSNHSV